MQKRDSGSLLGFSGRLDEVRFERPANRDQLTAAPNPAAASRDNARSCGATDAFGTSARFWHEHILWLFCVLVSCPIHSVRHNWLSIGSTWRGWTSDQPCCWSPTMQKWRFAAFVLLGETMLECSGGPQNPEYSYGLRFKSRYC